MKYTPEQIYSLYHRKIIFHTKGIYPRAIKNFDKIKDKPEWPGFVKFTKTVNNNGGQIDPSLYIDSLIDFNDGYFNFKLLNHPKGIKIYKTFVSLQNNTFDKAKIFKAITSSINFINAYMVENNIKDFDQYLNENIYLLPTMAKHFHSGAICKQFLVLIPDILLIIDNYPLDVSDGYFKDIRQEYSSIRSFLMTYPKLKRISDNMRDIMNKLVEKH